MNALSQLLSGMQNLLQWWIVLAPWEAGIRVRGGKTVTVLGAGIHFRIPFLDRFFVQSTRYRITDLPIQTISTEDGHTITLKSQVGYRITDIHRLYETLHGAEATIGSLAQSEISEFVVTRPLADCNPHQIEAVVTSYLGKKLREFGIGAADVTITDYARVKTYRLITQDIYPSQSPSMQMDIERFAQDQY